MIQRKYNIEILYIYRNIIYNKETQKYNTETHFVNCI